MFLKAVRTIYLSPFAAILAELCITSAESQEYGQCTVGHCGAKAAVIKRVCDIKKLPVAFLEVGDTFCWCACSCVAENTSVTVAPGSVATMGTLKEGGSVLALEGSSWVSRKITYSGAYSQIPEKPYPYAVFVSLSNGTSLITTADHPFLTSDGGVKRADTLKPTDRLLDKDKKEVTITSLAAGEYNGRLSNITTDAPKEGKLDGHIIETNGVLSGDFYTQNWLTPSRNIAEPQVGSTEYNEKYKAAMQKMPPMKDPIKVSDGVFFRPYKKLEIPPGSIHFLPDGKDSAAEGTLKPLDDTVPYEIAQYIAWHFKRFYPDVEMQIDWPNNAVNAVAWQTAGKKYVALYGGLIRHVYMKQEGIGLVVAHELAHHFGGEPRYPGSWASCEGQSDYWGALVIMREAWWGPEYIRQLKEGRQQVYNLFSRGLRGGSKLLASFLPDENEKDGDDDKLRAFRCSHPPALCRLQTYEAAGYMDEIPHCAHNSP